MTKPEAEALIERLADKTLSFGCRITAKELYGDDYILIFLQSYWDTGNTTTIEYVNLQLKATGIFNSGDGDLESIKILGHPILLGDVLEKIVLHEKCEIWEKQDCDCQRCTDAIVIGLWRVLGIDLSLQTILEGAEFEWNGKSVKADFSMAEECKKHNANAFSLKPNTPESDLFELLISLFPSK